MEVFSIPAFERLYGFGFIYFVLVVLQNGIKNLTSLLFVFSVKINTQYSAIAVYLVHETDVIYYYVYIHTHSI